ncbi:hypothetical protein Agub_g15947 [Astrephomene gubernaculifera]|uniref:Cystathionine beta-lyase, chloroplastic n=1 Tax=Astrephomene gubernaculifera TaxID=47775 RepID=A0AAD3E5V5_9CHLO|nr:hypothetical protein Agub_g15947 [Astrephomene gubernaculifera]
MSVLGIQSHSALAGVASASSSRPAAVPRPAQPRSAAPRPAVDLLRGSQPVSPVKQHASRASSVVAMSAAGKAGEKQTAEVPIAELRTLCTKALKTLGYTNEEIEILNDVLFYAQLRDNNQGIVKITSGGLNKSPAASPPVIEKETRLSALINGNNSAGMLVLHKATQMAIERARSQGFGIVGTNHTPSSTGALGYYVDLISREGLIGIVLAQSPEFVAPFGAKQPIFGTNPIGISIPAQDGAVTMDMATAAFAWFGLLEAKAAGRPIPPDVAMNAAGQPTSDPNEVLQGGAIRVFDKSYKGSNLALMVELLAGPLVGAAVADKLEERNWGNLVVAIDPGLLGEPGEIKRRVQVVLDRVRGAERLPGVEEILLPGERGNRKASARLAAGVMPLEVNLLSQLRTMAAKYDSQGSPPASPTKLAVATRLVHPKTKVVDPYGGSMPPLWQTATFAQPSATTFGEYDYTRSGNPTRTMLEEQFAALEGGDRGFAFTSGMAALAAVCRLVGRGGHIVAGEDIYGGTSRLLSSVVPAGGVEVTHVDMTDVDAVRAALRPGVTQLVLVESPTNPRMQICDIAAIAAAAREAGAITCVDNSIMAPVFQRPLDLGADICMTSGTKFVGGHGDVTLGLLTVKGEELAKRVYFLQNAEGAGLAPFDCWLALRGLKTMALRMERSAANAAALASFLSRHPLVRKVNYPGLPGHPGHELHMRQASGGGSLLSFETGDVEASKVIVEATQLFKVTVSFGNVNSLISLPCYMSHASIPAEVRAARGLPDDLVRISTGIEDVKDLIEDLDQAMQLAMEKTGKGKATAGAGTQQQQQGGNGASSSSSGSEGAGAPVVYRFGGNGNGSGAAAAAAEAGVEGERERWLKERISIFEAELRALQMQQQQGGNGRHPVAHAQ